MALTREQIKAKRGVRPRVAVVAGVDVDPRQAGLGCEVRGDVGLDDVANRFSTHKV